MRAKKNKLPDGQTDVKIARDRGSLRLHFSTATSLHYWGCRRKFISLGLKETKNNLARVAEICRRIQLDLEHPEGQFDPTLKKYLQPDGIASIKSAGPVEITLLSLWDDFSRWKLSTGQIHKTTWMTRYDRTYKNWLKPWLNEPVDFKLVESLTVSLIGSDNYKPTLKKLFSALRKMGDRAVRLGKLDQNYFAELEEVNVRVPRKSLALQEEENYRGFSVEERDTIIDEFYKSSNVEERTLAPLIKFLFLTGCRLGEAFALKWTDVKKDWIVFQNTYSTETKITKETKTNVTRLFKTKGYTKLLDLLKEVKASNKGRDGSQYVFLNEENNPIDRLMVDKVWRGKNSGKNLSPGVVSRLVDKGAISCYLKPSSTRHTMITIQARSGVDLKLLADCVGNSVDTIYKHYLGSDRNATLNNL